MPAALRLSHNPPPKYGSVTGSQSSYKIPSRPEIQSRLLSGSHGLNKTLARFNTRPTGEEPISKDVTGVRPSRSGIQADCSMGITRPFSFQFVIDKLHDDHDCNHHDDNQPKDKFHRRLLAEHAFSSFRSKLFQYCYGCVDLAVISFLFSRL